jgi:hypothetical protein
MECAMTDMGVATDLMSNVMQATQVYNTKVMEFATTNCSATVACLKACYGQISIGVY